jgi:hypothetical protein
MLGRRQHDRPLDRRSPRQGDVFAAMADRLPALIDVTAGLLN